MNRAPTNAEFLISELEKLGYLEYDIIDMSDDFYPSEDTMSNEEAEELASIFDCT